MLWVMDLHKVFTILEKKYFRNFAEPNVKLVLNLHYNGNDRSIS